MTRPPRGPCSYCAANSWTRRSEARTFSWRNASISSALSSPSRPRPLRAWFTIKMSSGPRASRAAATTSAGAAGSAKSASMKATPSCSATASVPPSSAPDGCAASCAAQPWTKTDAPPASSRCAIANPIPTRRLTPVTSALRARRLTERLWLRRGEGRSRLRWLSAAATDMAGGAAEAGLRSSNLARRAEDLPDQVERDRGRDGEARERDGVVHARHQRRRDEQADDDQRDADAVRGRPHQPVEVAEVLGRNADLERAVLELRRDLPQLPRQTRHRLELCEEARDHAIRLQRPANVAQDHVQGVSLDELDRIELRVERPGDRVGLGERLANERKAGRQEDPVAHGDALQVGEGGSCLDPRQGTPLVPRQLAAHFVDEARLVGVAGDERERDDQSGNVVGAVLRHREQQQPEPPADLVGEPADEAEIEQCQPAVVGEQDVAAVRVGVIDAPHRHLPHVRPEQRARQGRAALAVQPVTGLDLPAVDALQDQHALGDPRAHHLRYDELRLLSHDPPDQLGVGSLLDEIELRAQVRRELVDERVELQQAGSLGASLGHLRRRTEHAQVQLDLLEHPWTAHLDDDLATVREQRRMDLRDGRGRQRLLVDVREHAGADVALDDRAKLRERHGSDVVDEPAELLEVDVGKQVGAGGEDLAELDERRAELLERLPELARPLGRRLGRRSVSDLAQDADDVGTARGPRHLHGAPEAPGTDAHSGRTCPEGYWAKRTTSGLRAAVVHAHQAAGRTVGAERREAGREVST